MSRRFFRRPFKGTYAFEWQVGPFVLHETLNAFLWQIGVGRLLVWNDPLWR